jgi:tripartite-type tricarboxylate transporter receptor subunit TctC
MQAALKAPTVAEKFDSLGVQAMPLSPAEFGAMVAREVKTYDEFARRAGMKVN